MEVADTDSLDLIVAPHEYTPEDREKLRQAVEERRRRERDAPLSERAAQLLADRQAAARHNAPTQSDGIRNLRRQPPGRLGHSSAELWV